MKLTVLGGTGATGLEVLRHALADGHSVTAILRSPENLPEDIKDNPNLHPVKIDIFTASSMAEHMSGADAVLSCLGVNGASYRAISLYSESMKAITEAMEKAGTRRLVAMTSWCTKSEPGNPRFIEWFLKPAFIGRHCADMARMEDFLATKKDTIDFTTVRPAGLTNTPGTDKEIKVLKDAQWVPSTTVAGREAAQISRNDVARFMLSAVNDADLHGHPVAIGWP